METQTNQHNQNISSFSGGKKVVSRYTWDCIMLTREAEESMEGVHLQGNYPVNTSHSPQFAALMLDQHRRR